MEIDQAGQDDQRPQVDRACSGTIARISRPRLDAGQLARGVDCNQRVRKVLDSRMPRSAARIPRSEVVMASQ